MPRTANVARVAWLVAFILATGALTAVPLEAGAAAYGGHAPRPWAGFRLPATGHADGGWIGGYRADGAPVFTTTPRARSNRRGFGGAAVVDDYRDDKGASATHTARAAWILSKYGGYRDATQAAAVDATVYHLLVGGPWLITGRRGSQRIRQSGAAPAVRRFARIMLHQARKSAGGYGVAVAASGADIGGTVTGTVAVTTGGGAPAPGLPVEFSSPGAAPVTAVTGDDGVALARFAAPTAGWQGITATVSQVPDHRLHLLVPQRRAQATVAKGGIKRTLTATTQAAVRGPQTLSLKATAETVTAGTASTVVATVAGDGTSRKATGTLYGPFPSAGAARCSDLPVGTVTTTMTADGVYPLPAVTPTSGGFYLWRVAVDGGPTALPIAACDASVKVRGLTTTSVVTLQATAPVNTEVRARVTPSGVPAGRTATVTTTLFGPYGSPAEMAADNCARIKDSVSQTTTGDVAVNSTPIVADQAGLYAWQAQVSPGDVWLGSRSACLAASSTMSVP